ncbi:hypothetical protein GGI12_003526 [Dipsacomyces acuminosporus]|nr:hypothetical protein GGI12_003526 [Dipsacomyces acuminosporus]
MIRRVCLLACAIYWLLLSPSLAAGFRRTTTFVGTQPVTLTVTSKDGLYQFGTVSTFTSYFIFANEDNVGTTYVGTPVTSTYATKTVVAIVAITPTPSRTGRGTRGAVGGVLLLIILGVVGYFYYRKRMRKRQLEEHQREEMQHLALELGGSFNPGKPHDNHLSEDDMFLHPRPNGSITDDLASRYTGGSLSQNPPTLHETYSNAAYHINVGTELTMDSQGRHGLPDGSPLVLDSILPVRNVKAADNYKDLEWFPLLSNPSELQPHPGPNYVEDRGLSHIATYIQKSSTQKVLSPISMQK